MQTSAADMTIQWDHQFLAYSKTFSRHLVVQNDDS